MIADILMLNIYDHIAFANMIVSQLQIPQLSPSRFIGIEKNYSLCVIITKEREYSLKINVGIIQQVN